MCVAWLIHLTFVSSSHFIPFIAGNQWTLMASSIVRGIPFLYWCLLSKLKVQFTFQENTSYSCSSRDWVPPWFMSPLNPEISFPYLPQRNESRVVKCGERFKNTSEEKNGCLNQNTEMNVWEDKLSGLLKPSCLERRGCGNMKTN